MSVPTLFPDASRHPYYIVTPRYVQTSAGIKALHLLCHALNRRGYRAYLFIYPPWPPTDATHPDLLTPHLTKQVWERHAKQDVCPIAVYAETVSGNPLGVSAVVRYVMNYPGLLGGDKAFPPEELCFGYSKKLAESVGIPENVLFVPAWNTSIFHPVPGFQRHGTCYYAAKYKEVHRGRLLPVTDESVEITRDKPDSQTPEEIARLFQRSEFFYCYENSALAIEALLCECPVVFLPNEYFTEVIAAEELGLDGIAWGPAPDEIARARATVRRARENILRSFDLFESQLDLFIERTQTLAQMRKPRGAQYPGASVPTAVSFATKAFYVLPSLIERYGLFGAARRIAAAKLHGLFHRLRPHSGLVARLRRILN